MILKSFRKLDLGHGVGGAIIRRQRFAAPRQLGGDNLRSHLCSADFSICRHGFDPSRAGAGHRAAVGRSCGLAGRSALPRDFGPTADRWRARFAYLPRGPRQSEERGSQSCASVPNSSSLVDGSREKADFANTGKAAAMATVTAAVP